MLWYYKIKKNLQVCLTQAEVWDPWSLKIFSGVVHVEGQGASEWETL